ncbi:MAG: HNH endonuclease [Gammaproteobacteria bacterium]|nr:HNH endonuclease [Gammaproteobacteria bacterium]
MANTVVGALCRLGHDHEGSGGSLRYGRIGGCVECAKLRHVAKRLSETPEHREKRLEASRIYRVKNIDKLRAQEKEHLEKNRDRINSRRRELAKNGSDERNSRRRECYEKNRDEIRACRKKYREENSDAINKRQRVYKAANAERINELRKVYRVTHSDKIKASKKMYNSTEHAKQLNRVRGNNRRALLTEAGSHTVADVNHRVGIFNGICAYCGDEWEHIDHVVPLYLGGVNTVTNLVPACCRCNSSKGYKMLEDWYPKQSFYDNARHDFIIVHMGAGCGRPEFTEARGKESKVSLCESLFDFV